MRHRHLLRMSAYAVIGAVLASGCGGGGSATPTGPSTTGGSNTTTNPPAPAQSAGVTVNITGSVGSQSFSPNPVAVVTAQTLGFRNNDSTVHRIVADGGSFDSGNIQPGASSAPVTITTSSPIPFHCTIHPSMVGTINAGSASGGGTGDPSAQPGY